MTFRQMSNRRMPFRRMTVRRMSFRLQLSFRQKSRCPGSEVPKTLKDYHINNNRDNGLLNILYTNADSFLKTKTGTLVFIKILHL